MLRHRTLSEIAADVESRIAPAIDTAPVIKLAATNYKQVVATVKALTTFPAVVIVPTGAGYEGQSAYRVRDDRVNLILAGEWSAGITGSDTTVWDLADAVVRRFLPGNADGDIVPADPTNIVKAVQLQGVTYHPISLAPIAIAEERTAYNLLLQALNPMQTYTT